MFSLSKNKFNFSLMFGWAISVLGTTFAQSQTGYLNDGWQMQSSVLVKEEAKIVSTHAFKPEKWYPTKPGRTALNTLIKSGVYPDMYFGMNNFQIPDMSDTFNEKHSLSRFSHLPGKQNPWTSPWWYRTVFSLKSSDAGKTVWLEFDCINYRAEVWLNGQLVADREQVVGIFQRYQFDISNFVVQGDNVLAIKIFPPDHPGEPGTQLEPLKSVRPFENSEIMKDMTMVMSLGYDCFPTVRDRNMGILQDVRIRQTGAVVLRNPFVSTEMRLPKTDQATISVSAELQNVSEHPQKIRLRGKITGAELSFEQSVTLNPQETRIVRIKPFFMQKPKLWFPHGHGEQHLYTLSLEAVDAGGTVVDRQNTRFGVRQITTQLHEYKGGYGRQIYINGKRIFARGGYIQPDAMLEWSQERIKTEFRYYQEAGLNLIYFEDIPNPPDWFLDLCDEYGIMFGNCYFGCYWMQPDTDYPSDLDLLERGAVDLTKRYRNHPSLVLYMCMNEGPTREDVYGIWRNAIQEHDGTRFWIPSASFPDERYDKTVDYYEKHNIAPDWIRQDMPVGMTDFGASYGWIPVEEYFKKVRDDVRWMFMMESGSASLPPIESLRLFLPNIDRKKRNIGQKNSEGVDLFPLDEAWAEHGGNSYYKPYHEALYRLFTAPNDVADYCRKGHILTADQNRAMFEAVQHQMWNITSGFTQWKINSGWPSIQWQIFDWFHRPMVSYYFIKKANRPVHVLWSPLDDSLYVVNHRMETFRGTVYADMYDFNMKKLFSVEQPVAISADASSAIGLKMKRYDDVPEGVYFLKLRLVDMQATPVSDNFYWIPTQEKLAGLEKLPKVTVKHTASYRTEGDETVGTVAITNPTEKLAFFVRAILQKEKDGLEVLPVFWSDNYISLLPGESQTLKVRISTEHLCGQKPVVRLEGWNLKNK